jgi:3-dehydroquinate dehydratase/shikimate dehydrogenase
MAGSTALVATLMENPTLEALKEIPRQVSMLEVRGDSASLLPADLLRQYFPGELIYSTWRGIIDGSPSFPAARHCALKQAARDYDLVQLHADHDLTPEMLAAVPAQQRLICWKGTAQSLAQLRASFKRISAVPARFYLLVTQSDRIDAGAIPLLLLKELGRRDVIAYCEGKAGFWSRILSVHFGAPLIFGTAEDAPLGSGEPTVQQLIQDFGLPSLHPVRELYGIVGTRVFHSPSPRVHNAGYRALAHPALFLPFYAGSFEEFWREMIEDGSLDAVGLSLQGLTIISPYKETAFALAGWRSPMAQRAGACNLFLRRNDFWEAHTTDTDSIAGMAPASLRNPAQT